MRLSCDHTGYPWIEFDQLAVSLLPVTKYQFEAFLSEPGGLSNNWYEQLLAINPRCRWRDFEDGSREELFITGILPAEAIQFANWLGEGYDLPTSADWKQIDENFRRLKGAVPRDEAFQRIGLTTTAERLVTRLLKVSRIRSWHGLSLMRNGIMEWVHSGSRFGCHGVPRPTFWPVTHNPRVDPPQFPLKPDRRAKQCGFRLVRRTNSNSEDS